MFEIDVGEVGTEIDVRGMGSFQFIPYENFLYSINSHHFSQIFYVSMIIAFDGTFHNKKVKITKNFANDMLLNGLTESILPEQIKIVKEHNYSSYYTYRLPQEVSDQIRNTYFKQYDHPTKLITLGISK